MVTALALTSCASADEVKSESGSESETPMSTPISWADTPPVVIALDGEPRFTRIAALASGSSDVLISLGLADNVVGVSATENRPELSDKPVISPAHTTNVEQVLKASPDLVFLNEDGASSAELEQIKSQGAEVLILPMAFSDVEISTKVRSIGQKLGLAEQAQELLKQLDVAPPVRSINTRVAFLYLRGNNSIYLIGGPGSGADQLIARAGATDAGAKALSNPFTPLTAESIAELNPDVLLVMTKGLESVGGAEGLFKLPGVAQTQAGKEQKVIVVDDQLLLSFSTRTPALIESLKQRLAQVEKAAPSA